MSGLLSGVYGRVVPEREAAPESCGRVLDGHREVGGDAGGACADREGRNRRSKRTLRGSGTRCLYLSPHPTRPAMEHAYTHARILTVAGGGGRFRRGHAGDGPSGGWAEFVWAGVCAGRGGCGAVPCPLRAARTGGAECRTAGGGTRCGALRAAWDGRVWVWHRRMRCSGCSPLRRDVVRVDSRAGPRGDESHPRGHGAKPQFPVAHHPTPAGTHPPAGDTPRTTPARPPEAASARPTPSPGPRPPRRPGVPGGGPRRPSRGGRVPRWPFVPRGRSPGRFRRGPGGACGT